MHPAADRHAMRGHDHQRSLRLYPGARQDRPDPGGAGARRDPGRSDRQDRGQVHFRSLTKVSPRLLNRLWRHHLPLAVITGLSAWVLYVTRPYPDVITRLSFATAWPALVLLTVTLTIGPWRVLTG